MFNIILAPNAFKESLTAKQAIKVMTKALLKVDSKHKIQAYCLSDGGDGFLKSIESNDTGHYEKKEFLCLNAIGESILTPYLVLNSDTVVIETAQIIGLQSLKKNQRFPLDASSYGIGQIIKHALDRGIRRFIIGLGGSATNDGGTGLAQALGMRFFKEDQELPFRKSPLPHFTSVKTDAFDSRIAECDFKIICDVHNPLLGDNGAIKVFSTQKGANLEQQQILENQMTLWANQSFVQSQTEGAGAAGGLGFFFKNYTKSSMLSGSKWMLKYFKIKKPILNADLVITTEGKLDSQSTEGKLVDALAKECKQSQTTLVALVGNLEEGWEILQDKGLTAAFSILPHPASLSESIENTALWLEKSTEQVYRLFKSSRT